MNRKQFNRLKMFDAVIVVLDLFAAFIATVPALVAAVTKFKNLVLAIKLKANLQESAPAGKVTARDNARAALTKSLFVVMKGLKLHAQNVKDSELYALSFSSLSDLDRLPDIKLESTGKSMKEKAVANAESLIQYGITPETLTQFNQNFDAFVTALVDLTGGVSGQIAATTTLVDLYKQATSILETLDDLIDIADNSNVDLGLQYRAARVIKDMPSSHETKNGEEETSKVNETKMEPVV
jgi:hypothetical protein